ncbi:hypothetical protein MICA_241 [Micavibrio aeruginosavorus ARL-13]|uniref:Uncharacterized protein n=1 Tax=Micavibrio aeruginosavorus (strain ARL-13) TaxID=856793 RepID=G2KQ45_MICAA|nr:hypothetical protein MICA_241 [Micavibrio aeruginosavorus ARL-13]
MRVINRINRAKENRHLVISFVMVNDAQSDSLKYFMPIRIKDKP